MARRSTKAGPARSRRRPDPASRLSPSQSLSIMYESSILAGSGTLDIAMQLVNPSDGQNWTGVAWINTGQASDSKFIDVNGTVHPLAFDIVDPSGYVEYTQLTGLPAGGGLVLLSPLDPAVRSVFGDWIGGFYKDVTIN